ncbi:class I SAM-dependent methyltransferase [Scatolibacter rhodanostii]|uniref:class I SAM-dependent methyltransferase n=1 Tax=Scatolibacter rhodanostii TaxID=2014781 RepID=UPI000C08D7BA|nr:class I SAM-dependent methyltransferase [Scatolibacter rhodanostii]
MYNNIFKHLERPTLYKQNDEIFWNDEHISKHMLAAHLNPDFDGASRKLCFIDQSVKWISEIIPFYDYPRLLDIGCGPGLYAERFCKTGYKVTGIDFSKRSIEYAKNSANKQGLDITYVYQDYLKMDYSNVFDLATFIYCDYGALSTENRAIILRKIYHSLKVGGKLVLDVFSMVKYDDFEEMKTWNIHENGGFWSAKRYLSLKAHYKYSDNVTLEQTAVITDSEIKEYCIWNSCFTLKTLMREANEAGFHKFAAFSDVTGKAYTENSHTIAVVLEK